MFKSLMLVGCAVLFTASAAFGAVIIIDDFENPAAVVTMASYEVGSADPDPQVGFHSGLPPASTIGGRRDWQLDYIGGGGDGEQARARIVGTSPDQFLSFSNEGNIQSELMLTYGAAGNLDADFSSQAGLELYVRYADQASYVFVEVISNAETTSDYAFASYLIPADANPQMIFIPGADFPGIDGSDIDWIQFTFGLATPVVDPRAERSYVPGLDLQIDQITSSDIPEPCTMSLLALGGLALLTRRRK